MKHFICLIFLLAVLTLLLTGCDSGSEPPATTQATDAIVTPAPAPLASNEHVTVTFEKLTEEASIQGAAYLTLAIKNNSDREIWVYLDKGSVNDEQLTSFLSGLPTYIMPGKTSRNPFIISYSQLSIESISEIQTVEFDVVVADRESLDEMSRISGVKVTP